jgi:hypothetical protein
VLGRGTDIPADLAVFAEGRAGIGGEMGYNFGAGRGDGSAVEVVVAKEGGMGRERWMDAAGTEKVEGENGLGKETVPFGEGKGRIGGAEDGHEVVFKRPDSTFGGVGPMLLWRDSLEVDLVFLEGVFKSLGAFVIKNV